MGQFATGILFILFGLIVGGVGVVSAGIGIGIPMIPLGIYLLIRGGRTLAHEEEMKNSGNYVKQETFESTPIGRFSLGIILVIVGIAASAFVIGIPLVLIGVLLIISVFRSNS